MRNLPPLNALRAFEAAGRHANFRRAADELGVTQGAVAQQVRALEALLGLRLFHRQPRGLALTGAGRRYLPAVSRALDMLAEATDSLAPREAVVTISATPSFATKWLVPRLGGFAAAHPDIRLRIDAADRLADFQTDGVDIAVRLGQPPFGPGLDATPLFASRLIAVCHPDLAAGPPPIAAPADLRPHVLLEDTHGQWPLFLEEALGEAPGWVPRSTVFSQTTLAIDAALARQGVALCVKPFVASDLAAGRLCQPFGFTAAARNGYYVVTPRGPRRRELVLRVRDWLVDQAR